MSCSNLTGGISLDCGSSQGGIEAIFIGNGPVVSITEANGVITAITSEAGSITPASFYKFEVPKQTSSLNETITVSQENGTIIYEQSVTMIFNKLESAKRNALLLMAQATGMIIVVKDNNSKYWTVGIERGGFMTSGTATSGTAYADRSGYEITLNGIEAKPSFEVTASLVEA